MHIQKPLEILVTSIEAQVAKTPGRNFAILNNKGHVIENNLKPGNERLSVRQGLRIFWRSLAGKQDILILNRPGEGIMAVPEAIREAIGGPFPRVIVLDLASRLKHEITRPPMGLHDGARAGSDTFEFADALKTAARVQADSAQGNALSEITKAYNAFVRKFREDYGFSFRIEPMA